METKTLYNLLRMNWLREPALAAEPWQVADYRHMTPEQLFQGLARLDIHLDRANFVALAEEVDTPEELTEHLIADMPLEAAEHDQIYLFLFELWRRFVPEKLCLSIFCDELDHQIDLYDREELSDFEMLQDVLSNFVIILEDNTQAGEDPKQVFESICERCAHDVESFLYDFISDQLDSKNVAYATELLEDFGIYWRETNWLELLKARCELFSDVLKGNHLVRQLMKRYAAQPDLEFNMELLAGLIQGGERELFALLVDQTLPLLHHEEEFQDLLAICVEYFHFSDDDQLEMLFQKMLEERSKVTLEKPVRQDDPFIVQLASLFGNRAVR